MSHLPGSEKYRAEEPSSTRAPSGIVATANTVPIQDVLNDLFGIAVPSELTSSWKTRCPFGFEHHDGGIDLNFRVYPTNTAYCFALHGALSPVKIIMVSRDMRPRQAAEWLAERYELHRSEPYWEKMSRLILERENPPTVTSSTDHAVEAMQLALDRLPGYAERQYDEPILAVVAEALEELTVAMNSRREGAVREWLVATTATVRKELEK